jgi:hypothetical protein
MLFLRKQEAGGRKKKEETKVINIDWKVFDIIKLCHLQITSDF